MQAVKDLFMQPDSALWAWPTLVAGLCIVVGWVLSELQKDRNKVGTYFLGGVAAAFFSGIVTFLLIGSLKVTVIPEEFFLLDNQMKIVSAEAGKVFWKHPTHTLHPYKAREYRETKTVVALSTNPGLRHVNIHVQMKFGGTPDTFLELINSDWATKARPVPRSYTEWNIRKDKVRSLLNRFEKVYHTWIANNCYDDTDHNQHQALQEKFAAFAENELKGTGVQVMLVRFTLPN